MSGKQPSTARGDNSASAGAPAASTPTGAPMTASEQFSLATLRGRVDGIHSTIEEQGRAIHGIREMLQSHDTQMNAIDTRMSSMERMLQTLIDRSNGSTASATLAAPHSDTGRDIEQSRPDTRSHGGSIGYSINNTSEPSYAPSGRPTFTIKPEEIGSFDGTAEDTELFLSNLLAIYHAEPDEANLPAWEKAILRALPRTLRDEARLWFASLDEEVRSSLRSLEGERGWIKLIRDAFKPPGSVVRTQARERTWDPDQETISRYVFAKVALLKAGWSHFKDIDCMTDVIAGIPVDMRRLLRVPQLKNPNFQELRQELRTQEAYWREIHNRPFHADRSDAAAPNRAPVYGSLVQPTPRPPAAVLAQDAQIEMYVQQTPTPTRAPAFNRSARKGKSIRSDFDPKRLGYGVHPTTGQRTMTYKVPDTNEIMWCNRACRTCSGDHFDFAHDFCSTNKVHVAEVDDDYPVTSEADLLVMQPPHF